MASPRGSIIVEIFIDKLEKQKLKQKISVSFATIDKKMINL